MEANIRSSHPQVFLGKGVLKICSKLQSNFIEVALRHGCSPVNLLYIFRTAFLKNTSDRLFLKYICKNKRMAVLNIKKKFWISFQYVCNAFGIPLLETSSEGKSIHFIKNPQKMSVAVLFFSVTSLYKPAL